MKTRRRAATIARAAAAFTFVGLILLGALTAGAILAFLCWLIGARILGGGQ